MVAGGSAGNLKTPLHTCGASLGRGPPQNKNPPRYLRNQSPGPGPLNDGIIRHANRPCPGPVPRTLHGASLSDSMGSPPASPTTAAAAAAAEDAAAAAAENRPAMAAWCASDAPSSSMTARATGHSGPPWRRDAPQIRSSPPHSRPLAAPPGARWGSAGGPPGACRGPAGSAEAQARQRLRRGAASNDSAGALPAVFFHVAAAVFPEFQESIEKQKTKIPVKNQKIR